MTTSEIFEFGDDGDSYAYGDPTIDDIDLDGVAYLESRYAEIAELEATDPAAAKAAAKALVDELNGG